MIDALARGGVGFKANLALTAGVSEAPRLVVYRRLSGTLRPRSSTPSKLVSKPLVA